jgi:hypothetical protein
MRIKNPSSLKGAGLAALAVLLLAFFFYSPTDNWRWDPSFYYAQIRSPIIDGDFNYRDETIPANGINTYTAKGLQPSLWPVGPSVLWGGFFVFAHWLMLWLKPAYANGFSSLYIGLVSAGSALMGILGLLVQHKTCRRVGSNGLAWLTVSLALFATPLFYYIFRQPLMPHSASYLFATVILLACLLLEQGEIPLRWSGLILGVFTGVYAILRWSGLLIAILPLGLFCFSSWEAWKRKDRPAVRGVLLQVGIFLLAVLLCAAPQLATWRQLHGEWLVNPQTNQSVPFNPVHYLNLFLHTNRGLVFWSPFLLLGMIGLFFPPINRLRGLMILYVALYFLPFGFRWDWYGGGGFGVRYFLEILPMTCLGFMALFQEAFSRPPARAALLAVSALLIFHQFSLMVAYQNLGTLRWIEPEAYNRGRPLGAGFYLSTPVRVAQQPGLLLGRRADVGDARQTVFYSLSVGSRDLKLYAIPAAGLILLPLAALGFLLLDRLPARKTLLWAAVLLAGYQVGWSIYFLSF